VIYYQKSYAALSSTLNHFSENSSEYFTNEFCGVQTAAPILFDVFDRLPNSDWFAKPFDEMKAITICKKSGYRSSIHCDTTEEKYVQISGLKTTPCPYHVLIHVDKNDTYQVNTSCEDLGNITHKSWFVLPPLMAHYYKTKNPFYKPLPKFRSDCLGENSVSIAYIYPKLSNRIFLPKDFDGETNDLILKIAHSKPESTVFWYLDDRYMGSTKDIHELGIQPNPGKHMITVVDEFGNEAKRQFEISD